jgi:hypothetical protein
MVQRKKAGHAGLSRSWFYGRSSWLARRYLQAMPEKEAAMKECFGFLVILAVMASWLIAFSMLPPIGGP